MRSRAAVRRWITCPVSMSGRVLTMRTGKPWTTRWSAAGGPPPPSCWPDSSPRNRRIMGHTLVAFDWTQAAEAGRATELAQPDPLHQLAEPRIATQGRVSGVDVQVDEPGRTNLERPLEAGEGTVDITHRRV